MNLAPYLSFAGNCEEAMNFYATCFGGTITELHHYGGSPMETPESHKDKVMHCTMTAGQLVVMGTDLTPEMPPIETGNAITLMVLVPERDKIDTLFEQLAAGGEVLTPLADTFWNARWGMLKDKYGYTWSLNHDYSSK